MTSEKSNTASKAEVTENAGEQTDAKSSAGDQNSAAPLTAQAVQDYLKANPDFFADQAELLLTITVPHESGRAISLLEKQVNVFREKNAGLQEKYTDFVSNARDNDQLFEKTRLAVLDLLRCNSLLEINDVVIHRLTEEFDASASRLVFATESEQSDGSILNLLPAAAIRAQLGELFDKKRTFCGAIDKAQSELFFPPDESDNKAEAIISAAIVPVHLQEDSALLEKYGTPLLVIGSTDANHFNHSLDTLFLDFIGEVLAVHLHNLAG